MCRTSIYEARNNFSAYVEMAEQGEPVEITRYNKPVAIIISYDDFCKRERGPSLLDSLRELKEKYADVLDDEGIPPMPKYYPDPARKIFED